MRIGALDLALWDIQGQGARSCRCTRCSAAWCGITASATTPPASFPASRRAWASRSARERRWRRGTARSAWAPPTRRPIPLSTRTSASIRCTTTARRRAKASGKNGDWCVDFHQRFDLADAIRGCDMIQDLAPYFVEDPVRAEAFLEDLPMLRQQGESAARGRRGVGQPVGLQQAGGDSTTSTTCARRCRTSAASRR